LVGDLEQLFCPCPVERNVHAVRFFRTRLDFAEGAAEILGPHRPGAEHAHAAGVRDGDHERRVRRGPAHRRLEDRVLDAEELGDARLHLCAFSFWISSRAWPASLVSTRSNACLSSRVRQFRNASSLCAAARIKPSYSLSP